MVGSGAIAGTAQHMYRGINGLLFWTFLHFSGGKRRVFVCVHLISALKAHHLKEFVADLPHSCDFLLFFILDYDILK